jgi:hypothetical protein
MDTIFTLRGLVREDTEISNEMTWSEINTAALRLNVLSDIDPNKFFIGRERRADLVIYNARCL